MLKGFKFLASATLCLSGLTAFAQEATAAQWVQSDRSAHLQFSFWAGFERHSCNSIHTQIQGYPGSCTNDAATGWTANFNASSTAANSQLNSCTINPYQLGSACYGLAYAINGQAYAGGLPAACNVGSRAVLTSMSMETVEIQHEELDVTYIESAREFVCK